ncbi:MAG TPA: hypothetical protein VF658_05225 [Pyrinomonadaceae bacterium]|jgi:hypothetical protein
MSNTPTSPASSSSIDDSIPTGPWGGNHIRLNVSKSSSEVEFDCAHGTISEAIVPDSAGQFDVAGTFTRERGGPVRRGAETKSVAVRYVGKIEGETMTLTLKFIETQADGGTFTLTQGSEGRLFKCR